MFYINAIKRSHLINIIFKSPFKVVFLLFHFNIFVSAVSGQVQINEIVASNSIYQDSDGDSPDWIELYNNSSSAVSLHNWYLTDDQSNIEKW